MPGLDKLIPQMNDGRVNLVKAQLHLQPPDNKTRSLALRKELGVNQPAAPITIRFCLRSKSSRQSEPGLPCAPSRYAAAQLARGHPEPAAHEPGERDDARGGAHRVPPAQRDRDAEAVAGQGAAVGVAEGAEEHRADRAHHACGHDVPHLRQHPHQLQALPHAPVEHGHDYLSVPAGVAGGRRAAGGGDGAGDDRNADPLGPGRGAPRCNEEKRNEKENENNKK
eukprot:1187581-Prorocentrum_minimum.AAC.2